MWELMDTTAPSARSNGRASRRGPPFAARLLAGALAIVLLVATALAGSRYFYCPGMGVSQFTSCCSHDKGEAGDTGVAQVTGSCCESKVMGDLPRAQADAGSVVVAAAPLLAVLSASIPSARPVAQPARTVRARSGSDPPTPSRARSQLMVFLT
jgi:hypothetical protein